MYSFTHFQDAVKNNVNYLISVLMNINMICNGFYWADDHTCRLWDLETGTQKTCIPLSSAGVSVKWHLSEPNKVGKSNL